MRNGGGETAMSRWQDDEFLDTLKAQSDAEADAVVGELVEHHGIDAANRVFAHLRTAGPLPSDTPAVLRDFLETCCPVPCDVDHDRIHRGADAFMERAASGSLILLASSLPRGYASPALCEILAISNDLATNPYKRLMGVVQLLVNLSLPGAFDPGGEAVVSAQKLRLLHAGVRALVPRYCPEYEDRFGAPVSHENMLATIMAFSYLVTDGFSRLGLHFAEAEDYYYSWKVFAQMMGIHPPGAAEDDSLIPEDLEQAGLFYASYARRYYTDADNNPHGPILAAQNLKMMEEMVPRHLRHLGLDRAPRIVMTELLDAQALARIQIAPATGGRLQEELIKVGLRFGEFVASHAPTLVEVLARHIFQEMIDKARGGEVAFAIPDSLSSLRGDGLV